jgi:hypothetical protein
VGVLDDGLGTKVAVIPAGLGAFVGLEPTDLPWGFDRQVGTSLPILVMVTADLKVIRL